jgi:hypothetical protein
VYRNWSSVEFVDISWFIVPGVEEGSCERGVFIETSAEIRHTIIGKSYFKT